MPSGRGPAEPEAGSGHPPEEAFLVIHTQGFVAFGGPHGHHQGQQMVFLRMGHAGGRCPLPVDQPLRALLRICGDQGLLQPVVELFGRYRGRPPDVPPDRSPYAATVVRPARQPAGTSPPAARRCRGRSRVRHRAAPRTPRLRSAAARAPPARAGPAPDTGHGRCAPETRNSRKPWAVWQRPSR